MAQPPTIYKPGSLKYVWNNLLKTNPEYAKILGNTLGIAEIDSNLESLNNFMYNPTLGVNYNTVGPKVSFTRPDYSDAKDVLIPGELAITRASNGGGLYNPYLQNQYDGNGPTNTEWNSKATDAVYGWVNLENCLIDRSYNTWDNSVDGNAGYTTLLFDFIMRETVTGRAWLIKFTSWTPGGHGGGFSYDRYELFPSVTFTKNDYAGTGENARDIITPGKLEIARLDDQYGIFNYPYEYKIVKANRYDRDYAMMFTQWNSQYTDSTFGFADLTNVRTRVYDSFSRALDNNVGANIIGEELIMHDLINNTYYKVLFTDWTQNGNGGGFSYTRTLIPQNSVLTYPDGTYSSTAP